METKQQIITFPTKTTQDMRGRTRQLHNKLKSLNTLYLSRIFQYEFTWRLIHPKMLLNASLLPLMKINQWHGEASLNFLIERTTLKNSSALLYWNLHNLFNLSSKLSRSSKHWGDILLPVTSNYVVKLTLQSSFECFRG